MKKCIPFEVFHNIRILRFVAILSCAAMFTFQAMADSKLKTGGHLNPKEADQGKGMILLAGNLHELSRGIAEAGHESKMISAEASFFIQNEENMAKPIAVLSSVGIVASAAQAYQGVTHIKTGDRVVGGLCFVGSAANAASVVAGISGRALLRHTAGIAGAGIDGTIDIYTGFRKNDNEKLAVGGAKYAAQTLMIISVAQPETAPVLVPLGALTYGGAIATDMVYENQEIIGQTVYDISEKSKLIANSGYVATKASVKTACGLSVATCANATENLRGNLEDTALIVYERSKAIHDWLKF